MRSSCTCSYKVGSGSILPSAPLLVPMGILGCWQASLLKFLRVLRGSHTCTGVAGRSPCGKADSIRNWGNPGCFQAGKLLNSQRFPETIPLMGWKRNHVIFALVTVTCQPTVLCHPSHHQTQGKGICAPPELCPRWITLAAQGCWSGTRLPTAPGSDTLLLPAASPSCPSWEQLAPSITRVKSEQRCPLPAGRGVTSAASNVSIPPQLQCLRGRGRRS